MFSLKVHCRLISLIPITVRWPITVWPLGQMKKYSFYHPLILCRLVKVISKEKKRRKKKKEMKQALVTCGLLHTFPAPEMQML